jgi:hypothetical protein
MKTSNKRFKIFFILSLVTGLLFLLILNSRTMPNHVENGVLCFLIGFSMIWLLYLSIWFITKGFSKTAFPKQSEKIVNWTKIIFKSDLPPYQEKTLVEITGTMIMILAGLGLAALAAFIISGLIYTLGKIVW